MMSSNSEMGFGGAMVSPRVTREGEGGDSERGLEGGRAGSTGRDNNNNNNNINNNIDSDDNDTTNLGRCCTSCCGGLHFFMYVILPFCTLTTLYGAWFVCQRLYNDQVSLSLLLLLAVCLELTRGRATTSTG